MAEIEIGAKIGVEDLEWVDKIVYDICAANNAEVVGSGAGCGVRDWEIDVGRSRRRERIAVLIKEALEREGVKVVV